MNLTGILFFYIHERVWDNFILKVLKNLNKYPQVREVPFTKKDLIDFRENSFSMEDGQIRAPGSFIKW